MKKIYKSMCVMCALVLGTMGANAITKTWQNGDLDNCASNVFSCTGNHMSIVVRSTDDVKISYNEPNLWTKTLNLGPWKSGLKNFELVWRNDKGTTIKVNKVTLSAYSYGVGSEKEVLVKIGENGNETDVMSANTGMSLVSASFTEVVNGVAEDLADSSVTFTANRVGLTAENPVRINKIILDYNLIPDAPTLNPATAEVLIGTDSLNLSGYYTNYDGHFNQYMKYIVVGATPEQNDTLADAMFRFSEVGQYKVFTYIEPLADCHDKSANSDTLTINVNRLDNAVTVSYGAQVAINDTLTIELNQDTTIAIAFAAINPDSILVEQTEGAEFATYADSTITTLSAAGTAFIRFYQEQTDLYEAAQAVIKVVVKATPTALGNLKADAMAAKKIFLNGQLYILREGTYYNMQGAVVR